MNLRPHRRRLLAPALVTATATALLLSACAGDDTSSASSDSDSVEAGTPVTGGNLTIAIPSDPQSLDLGANPGQVTAHLATTIFEKLFAVDRDNVARPMLVDTYEISDDHLTYTFHLRQDVTFHDGDPLTAEDVLASLNRWFELHQTGQRVAEDVESLEADGDHTVILTLTQQRFALIDELASAGCEILKAEHLDGVDADGVGEEGIVGTGPYQLQSWTTGQEIVLERYDGYQSRPAEEAELGGYAGAKHAYLDTLTYKVVGDEDALINGLLTDQWQHAMPAADHYDRLVAEPDVEVGLLSGGSLNVLIPSHHEGSVFSDPMARQALNLAIDKAAINATTGGNADILFEEGSIAAPENSNFYTDAGTEAYHEYDPERAKQMFEEAGLHEGDTIRIVTSNTFPQFQQWSVLVQDQLGELGYNVTIDPYDFTTMLSILDEEAGDWDITTLYFDGMITSPEHMPPLNLNNLNGFESPEITRLLDEYNSVSSQDEASAIFAQLQTHLWEELPVIPLSTAKPYAAYSPKLKGYDHYWRTFWNSWLED